MVCWFLSSFVSATLQVLVEKLADAGIKACESVSDVEDKLRKLRRTVLRVQSVINNAEERQIGDPNWQALLLDLEQVVYDADDLLDEISIQGTYMLKDLVSTSLFSLYKRRSAPNMSSIQTKLDGMLGEFESLVKNWPDTLVTELQSSSLQDEANVFGRETDKRKIINMLLASVESVRGSNVSVIPIVGMIGVGKTSLAQLVYNHNYEDEMRHPFDLKMWVSVSKDFDVVRLTRSIIEAAKGEGAHLSNLESLHLELARILREKKFLLVLDDLWNEKRDEWDRLFEPLKYSLKGSKIIVTTRSHAVSSLVGTYGPYHLKCLSDDDCWLLLKWEAFGDVNLETDAMLEDIGMKIARKCKGFPLITKSVGRQLRRRVDEDAWNDILRSEIWKLEDIQDEVIRALRSACDHLPSHLKQCFAYCSMFPQSYQFEKEKTVRMWMGEGFIIPTKERKMVEDIGGYYFDQLFLTSFFQMEGEKYEMQGAVHDLAQSVFGEKFSRMEVADDSYINVSTRHLSIVCEKIPTKTFEATSKCKSLRTFLVFDERGTIITEVPHSLFLKLGRLRVLDLSSTQIKELTKSVGNLKHLRFLDLSNTLLKWLPETIQDLSVLQTLRLVNCSELLSLPKGISSLKGLRHLELDGNNKLTSMPNGIGRLTGLHTISEFVVGQEDGQMKEMKGMNNIRGTLRIKRLENVRNPHEALEANLANKVYLEELDLQWTSVADAGNDEYVLDKLMTSPHANLKRLILGRYGGRMFPTWVSSAQFYKLTSIFFNECEKCGLLPPLGQLPKLKSLKIIGMHELTKVDHTFLGVGDVTGFPSLETLELRDLPKLEGWVGVGDGDMASLREFTISECPEMVILPSLHHLRSLQKLEFESCTQLSSFAEQQLASSVKSLVIIECPLLEERCKRNGGDWTMIEHIPYIELEP